MKGLAAAALAVAVAVPAAAQRGGGHAGFSGRSAPAMRSAPAFHSSFAPRPSFSYSRAPMTRPPMAYAPRVAAPAVRYPVAAPLARPTFYHHGTLTTGRNSTLRRYPHTYYSYFYPGVIYLGGLYDDWDDSYFDNQQQPLQLDNTYAYSQSDNSYQPQPEYSYAQPAPEPDSGYAYPQPGPESPYINPAPGYAPYPPQPAPAAPQMQYVPGSSDTVTLIFKDGRPPEQIQNYLATRTTLTILDNGRRREVPLAELDIPATLKANRETGVDFELPTTAR